ncbi:MAG TPA: hypothetical protein VFO34_13790 [Candidatus Acidoferrales bacterium]|nr:hypothetical protein [Candidatus Acidoferrales bacterium]
MKNTNRLSANFLIAQAGMSILELMAALGLLLLVSGTIMGAMLGMMKNQAQVQNRTEMHSSVRGATELIEQEITQAGRVVLPGTATLTTATVANAGSAVVSSVAGMFVSEQLTFDSGPNQDTVQVSAINVSTKTLTLATGSAFFHAHSAGVAVVPLGGFSGGVVPPSTTNGSDGTHLKLFGDINGDGNMVYIEYTCDYQANKLYRNVMLTTAVNKLTPDASMVILDSVYQNPNDVNNNPVPCFNYQVASNINGNDYVLDVAVTLTVYTQHADAWTGSTNSQSTKETKALLNVAPRNVFETWLQASAGITDRVQPIPANVTCLLNATSSSSCTAQ